MRARAVQALSVLRQLQLSIQSYHVDFLNQNKQLPYPFPQTLDDLVTAEYFPQDALDRYRS